MRHNGMIVRGLCKLFGRRYGKWRLSAPRGSFGFRSMAEPLVRPRLITDNEFREAVDRLRLG
jgi:hypothetical protein